jgi:hypothetical protein
MAPPPQKDKIEFNRFLPAFTPKVVNNVDNEAQTVSPILLLAQRTADSRYQLIYTSLSPIFNYWVLCDATDVANNTSFATAKDATDFLNSPYVESPANKKFVKFATTAAKDVFTTYESDVEIYAQNRTPPKTSWC